MNDDDMTGRVDASDPRLKSLFDDCVITLVSVRETLAVLVRAAREGESGSAREITAKQKELETALMRAIETEQKYHEWKSKREGRSGAGGDGFDLDAARAQIGCRLARIRECCREG